jgi:hypothetical protein
VAKAPHSAVGEVLCMGKNAVPTACEDAEVSDLVIAIISAVRAAHSPGSIGYNWNVDRHIFTEHSLNLKLA